MPSLLNNIYIDLNKKYGEKEFPLEVLAKSDNKNIIVDQVVKGMARFCKMDHLTINGILDTDNFFNFPAADGDEKDGRIYLPMLFSIDFDKAPADLQVTSSKDPRLNDIKFVQKLASWAYGVEKKVSIKDRVALKIHFKFLENLELAKSGVKFIISHELGHIHYGHSLDKNEMSKLFKIINVFSLGLFSLFYKIYISRKREREADIFSCTTNPAEKKGGLYLFKILKKNPHGRRLDKIVAFFNRSFCALTHTSFNRRYKRLVKL